MKRILRRIGRLAAKLLRWAIAHPDVVLDLVAPDKYLRSMALDAVRVAKGIANDNRARREYAADMIARHAEGRGIEISHSQTNLLIEAAYQAVKAARE